jgi:CheY-like chemotaxis protein
MVMTLELLVVDDESDNADSLCLILRLLGHRAQACYSAAQALSRCAVIPFDGAIVDVAMPLVSGLELCEALCTLERRVPVVLFTGYNATRVADEAKAVGALMVLQKPFTVDEVTGAVEAIASSKAASLHVSVPSSLLHPRRAGADPSSTT